VYMAAMEVRALRVASQFKNLQSDNVVRMSAQIVNA
jgi:hypothetical protein